jgi:hypothetical protein
MTNDNVVKLTDNWISLLREKRDDEALGLYCDQIVPNLLPDLREQFKNTYGDYPHYDGLISLLGFTPDTVVLAYRFIQPQTMVILHTQETAHLLETVVKYAHVPFDKFFHEPFADSPYISIYHALDAALRRFPQGSRIAIELTGGKKTMGGALAVAAGMLNIDLVYIDYTDYMPEYRKPKPASTYIHLVENPIRLSVDLFGSIEMERAAEFFNIGKHDTSRTLFEQAGQRMANPRVAEFCMNLSQFYALWNSFNFQEAVELSSSLIKQGFKFYEQISRRFVVDLNLLQNQSETVRKLAQADRFNLMWNFFFAAERYESNSQNDIAALLYYRTIESVFDNALKDIAEQFDRSNPDYTLLGIELIQLQNKYQAFRQKVYKKNNGGADLPTTLAMFDSLCLLGALEQPLAQKLSTGKIANAANVRNLSVYAHGSNPMKAQSVATIRDVAREALQAYTEIKHFDSIADERLRFQFIELKIRKN